MKFISIVLIALPLALSSCGEVYDRDGYDWEPEPVFSDTVFNRVIQILNLDEHQPFKVFDDILFSLENIQPVSPNYQKTNRWDIVFNFAAISCNNGKNGNSLGYGSNSLGGIRILEADFNYTDNVLTPDEEYGTAGGIGLDDHGDFGTGIGWLLYDYGGGRMRVTSWEEGEYDPEDLHIAYAMGDTLYSKSTNRKYAPRVIHVRTSKGNYAKVKMQSFYKNKLNQNEWKKSDRRAYSFQYVLVKSGSKTFKITGDTLIYDVSTGQKRIAKLASNNNQ